jgi:predicted nucleic acid-binding protein
MRACVLDSSALMTLFEDRPGADKIADLLAQAGDKHQRLSMPVVNWGEVYYAIWRVAGENKANEKLQQIAQLPIEIVGVDMTLARAAARIKAENNLPYAGCFAAALAQMRKAILATSDRDFERVEKLIQILWI